MESAHTPEAAEQVLEGDPVDGEEETPTLYVFVDDKLEGLSSEVSDGLPVFTDEDAAFIARMSGRFEGALKWAKNLIITDQASLNIATGNLSVMKKTRTQLDRRRKDRLAPIEARKKSIHNPFKLVIDKLTSAIDFVDGSTTRYMDEEEKRQLAAAEETLRREREALVAKQKELEEQAALNESDHALDDALAVEEHIQEIDNTQITTQVRGRGSLTTASITRRVSPDLIVEAIQKGIREIPGVRIYQVWTYVIEEVEKVPNEYRKATTTNR